MGFADHTRCRPAGRYDLVTFCSNFATRPRRAASGASRSRLGWRAWLPYPHVALIVETAKQYDRGLLRGIGRYIKGHGPWSVYLEERGPRDAIPSWLRTWKGDGIIARIKDVPMAEALLATGVPIVELRRQVVGFDLPAVHCDDAAIAATGDPAFPGAGVPPLRLLRPAAARWSDLRESAYRRGLGEPG